ncbi:MAG: hypothetical protein JST96_12120, partial [Bacteroidetes bacterium]|nr:hypothetical protein [Bacteroidota bacterium]
MRRNIFNIKVDGFNNKKLFSRQSSAFSHQTSDDRKPTTENCYVPSDIATIKQPLRRTLVQMKFYSPTCNSMTKHDLSFTAKTNDLHTSHILHLTSYIMRYVLPLVIAIASFSSCKKILDVNSPNAVDNSTIFTSVSGLENARIGMYSTLQDKNYYGGYYPLLAECYTDNGTTGGYDVIDLNDIASRTVETANIYTTGIYQAIYNSIYTANSIINNI